MSGLVTTGAGAGSLGAGGLFVPTAVKTAAYTASPGDLVPADTTSGNVTVTLPTAPADGAVVAVKMVKQGSTNAVTVAAAPGDVFNFGGTGGSSMTLALLYQGVIVQYRAPLGVWYVLGDDLALSQLDARYGASGALGATTFSGLITANAGTDTAGSAPVITAPGITNSASASQLSDTSRDYQLYIQVGTPGTALTISIGHTSAATDAVIFNSATPGTAETWSFRVPAGWYILFTGTSTTIAHQVAVGC